LAYPDYDQVFEIFADASSKQLGTVMTQDNMPITVFSRKLSETQQKYSIIELELLGHSGNTKKFKGMLWGQRIKVWTNQQIIIQDALGLTSYRM